MVAPGVGFRGVTLFIGQNLTEDQKKKGLRCKTSWFSVRKYVMTKKKVFAYQSVGFWSQKKKKTKWCHPKMVTPGAGRPPSDATANAFLALKGCRSIEPVCCTAVFPLKFSPSA